METKEEERIVRSHPADAGSHRTLWTAGGVLLLIFTLIGSDLISDYRAGSSMPHLIVEAIVMLLAGVGALLIWQELRSARLVVSTLTRDMKAVETESARWREETRLLLDGLAEAMSRQFDRWKLTEAEREVALALLKGLSHKEIARARRTSERTVREQGQEVYAKSGLQGRAALAGFFLDGLLTSVPRR